MTTPLDDRDVCPWDYEDHAIAVKNALINLNKRLEGLPVKGVLMDEERPPRRDAEAEREKVMWEMAYDPY